MCSLLFFILPTNKNYQPLLSFSWFKNVPWNILILFGGGLSMASLVVSTGLAQDLSQNLNFMIGWTQIVNIEGIRIICL